MKYVQSFISNISFPTSIDELFGYARLFNIEMILGSSPPDEGEEYTSRKNEWTAPKWCKRDDIVFFMHSKTANARISALKTELIARECDFDNDTFWLMMNSLFRAKQLHTLYGGKIFAIAKISGALTYHNESDYDTLHWKSRIYAPIDSIFLLQRPIDISEFNNEIKVSRQSSITPVFGSQFDYLKSLILRKNHIVDYYFRESVAAPIPLTKLNDNNWIELGNKYRRSFFLEIQYRTYYVNYLLKYLGDQKTIYTECTCIKSGEPKTFVDNTILFHGRYLPVEVKLSVSAEKNIVQQLKQYCYLDELFLTKEKVVSSKIYENYVLVIDTEQVFLYNDNRNDISPILDLDNLKKLSDVEHLKQRIIDHIIM